MKLSTVSDNAKFKASYIGREKLILEVTTHKFVLEAWYHTLPSLILSQGD